MKNLMCQKRRRIIIRKKDGDNKEVYRCAHGATEKYKHDVDENTCQSCTLRQPLLKVSSVCKEHPPKQPIWPEPYYTDSGDVVYQYQENIESPPEPQGYERKGKAGKRSWQFTNKWVNCKYRHKANILTPKGDLQVRAFCGIKGNRPILPEDCEKCLADVISIGGNLDTKQVENNIPLLEPISDEEQNSTPDYPSTIELLDSYWKAVKRWVAAGRPTRTDSEVEKIHEEFCSKCNWYDSEAQRCKGCGCRVREKGAAILNKIKMKTEHCPRNFW